MIEELGLKNQPQFMSQMWVYMIQLQKKQLESQQLITQKQVKNSEFPKNLVGSFTKQKIRNIKEQKEAKVEK